MRDAPPEKANVLKDKSYAFAVRIVKAHRHIVNEQKEFVLSKQLLRSGTSIGANVAEANQAQSRADFINNFQSPSRRRLKRNTG